MKRIVVIAPHPDDEILGCGGSIVRFISEGAHVSWVIATDMCEDAGYSKEQIEERESLIARVTENVGFHRTYRLGFPAGMLDSVGKGALISAIKVVLEQERPDTLLIPFHNDVHSDHRAVSEASIAASKWFRMPWVQKILMYETPSETGFNLSPGTANFTPNLYVDISKFMEIKKKLLALYSTELEAHPFPRSLTYVESLAICRGAHSGQAMSEAFMLIWEKL